MQRGFKKGSLEVRHGLHLECFKSWFDVSEDCEFQDIYKRVTSEGEPSELDDRRTSFGTSFFHGQFKKYEAKLGSESYILKVQESEHPELPAVEFLSNQIAEKLKLPVAKYFLINFLGKLTFVTKNFCYHASKPTSLSHIYRYLKKSDEHSCEKLINIIYRETEKLADVTCFINMCLFDSLIGNHDRHGRNIGLLITSSGKTLSPIYDNTSYLGIEDKNFLEADINPRGKIYTKRSKEPTFKHYFSDFERLGYGHIADLFLTTIKRNKNEIMLLIDNSFCSKKMKNAFKKLILKRLSEVC